MYNDVWFFQYLNTCAKPDQVGGKCYVHDKMHKNIISCLYILFSTPYAVIALYHI